jgi:putative flavoprotein involved in K+ transport
MRFPASSGYFPTKDEMADFLEGYARHFSLPVRLGSRVSEVVRDDAGGYLVRTDASEIHADQVVIAASSYQKPKLPAFAGDLDAGIRQFHSSQYRNPAQLADGPVLLVGAGNSGAEIGIELAGSRKVFLAGNHPGEIPVRYDSWFSIRIVMPIVFRLVFHRLLSVDTRMGRKARPRFLFHSGPLIRVKPQHLEAKGVKRVGRIAGVRGGQPLTEDGTALDVANVVWCTGFKPWLDWIKLPIFDENGRPRQYRGAAEGAPGLHFVGLPFQHSASSTMIHGVARDAGWVAEAISRQRAGGRLAVLR